MADAADKHDDGRTGSDHAISWKPRNGEVMVRRAVAMSESDNANVGRRRASTAQGKQFRRSWVGRVGQPDLTPHGLVLLPEVRAAYGMARFIEQGRAQPDCIRQRERSRQRAENVRRPPELIAKTGDSDVHDTIMVEGEIHAAVRQRPQRHPLHAVDAGDRAHAIADVQHVGYGHHLPARVAVGSSERAELLERSIGRPDMETLDEHTLDRVLRILVIDMQERPRQRP